MTIEAEYKERWETYLKPIANKLQLRLIDDLKDVPRIDRITARAKDPIRFISKSRKFENEKPKYVNPLLQIQDQIGARVVVFYISDVAFVEQEIEAYYRHIEKQDIIPESDREFGYVGKHYILRLPEDVIDDDIDSRLISGDAEAYMRLNHAFHFHIYRASGSQVLLPLIDSLWLQFAPFMRTVYGRVGTASLIDQHKEAIRAIERQDSAALRAAITADITDGMGLLGREILASNTPG